MVFGDSCFGSVSRSDLRLGHARVDGRVNTWDTRAGALVVSAVVFDQRNAPAIDVFMELFTSQGDLT